MIEKVIHIVKKDAPQSDFQYWQQQSPDNRLRTLEEIRQEYNHGRYDHQQGFQRVYRIIKQAPR